MSTPIDAPMNEIDPLKATLLDLLYELREQDLPLILGGGYGLFLKQQAILEGGEPLLLEFVPPTRSTNDLDLFLRTEIIADSVRLRPLREALDRLGFTVIRSAQNYQFARKFSYWGQGWDIKIDLLTKTPEQGRYPHVKMDARRVKPHPSVGVHAHRTDEAIAIEEEVNPYSVTGSRTGSSEPYTGVIYLPSAYSLLMMKLFALRDQVENPNKEFGSKHALDLYRIVALLTEKEYQQTLRLSGQYAATVEGQETARIVATLFASLDSVGMRRLQAHRDFPRTAEFQEFQTLLREFFPQTDSELPSLD